MAFKRIREFNSNDKFLSLNVYQFPLGDCGGVTDNLGKQQVYIPCDEGTTKYLNIENKHLIFLEEQRSEKYWCIKPNLELIGNNGPMNGGNLAYSSDSRCSRIYHIHDRFEKWN